MTKLQELKALAESFEDDQTLMATPVLVLKLVEVVELYREQMVDIHTFNYDYNKYAPKDLAEMKTLECDKLLEEL